MATPTLGYEVDGFPQSLVERQLVGGIFKCGNTVEYVPITSSSDGVLSATKAICLLERYYMFNPETMKLEEEDIVDEGISVVKATTSAVIRSEKNEYVMQYAFDCFKEEDEQGADYQPLSGLSIDTGYLNIKTHNFCNSKDYPKKDDLVFYMGQFWVITETRRSFVYTPKEKSTLHLALKTIKI